MLTIANKATNATLDELTQSGSITKETAESFDFCGPCGTCFTGSVGGGSYTTETSWEILDSSGAVVASASNDGAAAWCSGPCSSTICGEGQQPNAADDGCEPCEAGYFSDASGIQPCVPCAPGAFGAGTGATGCSECAVGTASSLLAATEEAACETCSAGK